MVAASRLGRLPGAASVRRIVLVLAALLAFAGHGFLTQTHIHLPEIAAHATSLDAGGGLFAKRPAPTKAPAACPICREYLHAGHYVPPVPIVFGPAAVVAAWLFVPLYLAWHGRQRSHAWRSRGPPTYLRT